MGPFFSFPFDEYTILGFVGITIFTLLTLHNYGLLVTTNTGFFVGSAFYIEAFFEDFEDSFSEINSLIVQRKLVRQLLAENVKFHIKIIQ